MKYDLHIHSKVSYCSNLKPSVILKMAEKKKLDGIAVTDHNTTKGAEIVSKFNKNKDFEVVIASEIRSNYGDILVYYQNEPIVAHDLFEIIDEAKKQDALVAVAHPFRIVPWLRFKYPLKELKGKIDAVESFNSRSMPFENMLVQDAAKKLGITGIGGSDGHFWFDIGNGYTVFEDDLRSAIKKNKTKVGGSIALGTVSGTASFVKKRILRHLL